MAAQAKDPGGQGSQREEPARDCENPAGQAEQTVAPEEESGWTVPAEHGMHPLLPCAYW